MPRTITTIKVGDSWIWNGSRVTIKDIYLERQSEDGQWVMAVITEHNLDNLVREFRNSPSDIVAWLDSARPEPVERTNK